MIDLTMPLDENTPVYPGDPKPEFNRVAFYAKDGWNEHRICINTHLGTHIDAPWHMIDEGKRLSDFPIEKFVGRGLVVDVRGQEEIDDPLEGIRQGDIVLLRTDHTKKAATPEFFTDNPVISRALALRIVEKQVSIVGIDSFGPDNPPFEVHKLFFEHDILSLENLVSLDLLPQDAFQLFVFPIRLEGLDAAPCRVIAIVE